MRPFKKFEREFCGAIRVLERIAIKVAIAAGTIYTVWLVVSAMIKHA